MSTFGTDDRGNSRSRSVNNQGNLHGRGLRADHTCGITITYDWTQQCQQCSLGLVEFLLRLGLHVEGHLASLLITGSFKLDFVLCHNLLHDLTQGSGFAILASTGQVDRRQRKRVSEDWSLGDRLDARAIGRAPRRLGGGRSRRGGSKRRKCCLRVGVQVLDSRSLGTSLDGGGVRERRKRIWCAFELVSLLRES